MYLNVTPTTRTRIVRRSCLRGRAMNSWTEYVEEHLVVTHWSRFRSWLAQKIAPRWE